MSAIVDFKQLTVEEAVDWFESIGQNRFRGKQMAAWTRVKGVDDFALMTDMSKALRATLAENATVTSLSVADRKESADGTIKFLFALPDGHTVESVWIPETERATMCVSSQVGCKLDCAFCLTGAGGFVRNLSAAEIVDQVVKVRLAVPDQRITNLVFMGMGEPLDNFDNLVQALKVITDPELTLVGGRRITVSTCGLAPAIERLATEFPRVKLAVSLNGTTDAQRGAVMPVNRAYPLDRLFAALRRWPLPQGRRITFEYVMLAGINDSLEDAERLHQLTKQLPSTLNLIPFNECPGISFRRPSPERVAAFREALVANHRVAIVRESRGQDISAACGQLRESAATVK